MDCLDEDKWTCTEPDEDEVRLIVRSHGLRERRTPTIINLYLFKYLFAFDTQGITSMRQTNERAGCVGTNATETLSAKHT